MEHVLRAAVVQTGSAMFDIERTLAKVERNVVAASKQGSQLIVFPEAFVSAYPKGLHFGAPIGERTPERKPVCGAAAIASGNTETVCSIGSMTS